MACNLYLTVEPERKLRQIFSNAKNFYMLDIQELIKTMGLDPRKSTSVYLINEEIQRIVQQQASLKKVQGIFYIVTDITEALYNSLKKKTCKWPEISDIVLIDNGQVPQHNKVAHLFNDVIFYEYFKKNKIPMCTSLMPDDNADNMLAKALEEINSVSDNNDNDTDI